MMTRLPRLPKAKQNKILLFFLKDIPASVVAYQYKKDKDGKRRKEYGKEAGLVDASRPCVNRYYTHFRELIYRSLQRAPRLAGEVEMDQAFFGGRAAKREAAYIRRLAGLPTLDIKKKFRKKKADKRILTLGFLQRGGLVYTHTIARADAATLFPVIRLVIEQGATIYSDEWAAFNDLKLDGYTHLTVNHSLEYSDKKGRHINNMEGFWSFAKTRLSKFKGISRRTLPLHIKESEWRWNNRDDLSGALRKLLAADKGTGDPVRPAPQKSRSRRTSRSDSAAASRRRS